MKSLIIELTKPMVIGLLIIMAVIQPNSLEMFVITKTTSLSIVISKKKDLLIKLTVLIIFILMFIDLIVDQRYFTSKYSNLISIFSLISISASFDHD